MSNSPLTCLPTSSPDGSRIVADELAFQTSRKTLVQQDAHGREAPPWPAQGGHGLLSGDRREILQELGKRLPRLEVIEECREGTRVPTNMGVPPMISGSL